MEPIYGTDTFWSLYDQYIENNLPEIKRELLIELKEMGDTIRYLARPDEGWKNIVGWEVLQRAELYFHDDQRAPFLLLEGEMILDQCGYDRDVLITRYPHFEMISGYIMRFNKNPIFLPLYQVDLVTKKTFTAIENHKASVREFFEKEKTFPWFQEA